MRAVIGSRREGNKGRVVVERGGGPAEPDEVALKRLRLRSWRRGIKEMDLVLGAFADAELAALPAGDRRLYDSLLSENDHDLYGWFTGTLPAPARWEPILRRIQAFHGLD